MKNTLIAGLIAGVIGGVAATAVSRMVSPVAEEAAAGPSDIALQPEAGGDAELVAELDSLRLANEKLSMRLAALETRSPAATREAIPTDGGVDVAALQEQVVALAAALENPQSAQSAGLRSMVASALGDVQAAESEQRQIEREQRDLDRIVESMDEYTEKLGLNTVQRKSMQAVLIDSSAKRNTLFTSMRDGSTDRGSIREAFTTMRDETNASLQTILSPQQFDDYSEMNGDRGRFGGGGGGGRGR